MSYFNLKEALIKTTKILAGDDIPVYTEGFQPRVEFNTKTKKPVAIYIPTLPDDAPQKLISAIHGFIDHECSHLMFSSPDDICDTTKDKLWHFIHNCIDDPRVNHAMTEYYAGSGRNLRAAYDFVFNEPPPQGQPPLYDPEFVSKMVPKDDKELAELQLMYAPLWFSHKMKDGITSKKYNELGLDKFYKPLEDKMDKRWLDKLEQAKSTDDVRDLSDYYTKFFSQEAMSKMMPDKGDGEGGEGEEKGKPGKPQDGDGDGKPMTAEERRASEEMMNKLKSLEQQLQDRIQKLVIDVLVEAQEPIYWTDRFDEFITKDKITDHGRFRRDYRDYNGSLQAFEDSTKSATNYISKELRRILEERRRRYYVGGYKSGKLNSRALYSARLGNDRIFKKKNEVRDVNAAVSLLIDLSGSMSGKKVSVAMQSAYAFAMCLEQIKVPYEIYGFTTRSHDSEMYSAYDKYSRGVGKATLDKIVNINSPEMVFAFKQFNEAFDITSKQGMFKASNSGVGMIENEDSKHVVLAMKRLAVRPETVKALFVFSDGYPAYGQPPQKSYNALKYHVENSKKKYGVDVYGIGICSDSVKKFYDRNVVVNNIEDLPTELFKMLRKVFDEA